MQAQAGVLLVEKQAQIEKIASVVAKILKLIEDADVASADVLTSLQQSLLNKKISTPVAGSRRPVPVKFRDGANSWSGRGIKPKWATEYIAKHGSLDGALVK